MTKGNAGLNIADNGCEPNNIPKNLEEHFHADL